uniref:Uncharacterized protein n=2 Tax=Clytia hemisphaerica TaxID=252671 RepID=A0A7M5WQC9_9CNID
LLESNSNSTLHAFAVEGSPDPRYIKFFNNGSVQEYLGLDIHRINGEMKANRALCLPATLTYETQTMGEVLQFFDDNFEGSLSICLATLGAVVIAQIFNFLKEEIEGVPTPVLFGKPGQTKSCVAGLAFACIGLFDKTQDNTAYGIKKLITSSEDTPIWLEDQDDFSVFQDVNMTVFNQTSRETGKDHFDPPNAMPIITTNGFWHKAGKDFNLQRVLGRTVVLYFEKDDDDEDDTESEDNEEDIAELHRFEKKLKQLKKKANNSFVFINCLRWEMENFEDKPLHLQIVQPAMKPLQRILDRRSLKNYSLLINATGKILEKCGRSEQQIKDFANGYVATVESFYKNLDAFMAPKSANTNTGSRKPVISKPNLLHIFDYIRSAVHMEVDEMCIKKAKSRCDCGNQISFAFKNIMKAIDHRQLTPTEIKLMKAQISTANLGCVSHNVKHTIGQKQYAGVHISVQKLPEDLRAYFSKGTDKTVFDEKAESRPKEKAQSFEEAIFEEKAQSFEVAVFDEKAESRPKEKAQSFEEAIFEEKAQSFEEAVFDEKAESRPKGKAQSSKEAIFEEKAQLYKEAVLKEKAESSEEEMTDTAIVDKDHDTYEANKKPRTSKRKTETEKLHDSLSSTNLSERTRMKKLKVK